MGNERCSFLMGSLAKNLDAQNSMAEGSESINLAMDPSMSFAYSHLLVAITLLLVVYFLLLKSHCVYLIDFSCYLPPAYLRVPASKMIEHMEMSAEHGDEDVDFILKMTTRSGIGPEACLPHSVHQIPPDTSLKYAKEETETILCTAVKDILTKHNVNPKNIDILVTNCSIFCPTPSISAMIISKFRLRSNVKNLNLSGMGCSASLVAINLAKDLLRVHRNSLALVLSMEAMTPAGYSGKVKSMLLSNVLFRMGGVAVLQSVSQESDDHSRVGVLLTRSLLQVAGNAQTSRKHSSISAYMLVEGQLLTLLRKA